MREAKLRTVAGSVELYDVNALADALFIGMLSGYIYGRAHGYGSIRKAKKKQIRKVLLQEPSALLRDVVNLIARSDRDILHSLIGVEITDPMLEYFHPPEEALNFLANYTVQLAHVLDEDMTRQMTAWITDTIREGMSEREAIDYLAQKATKFSESRIQKIARTEATRAFNIGTLEETKDSEIVAGYKFVAVLDDRTTEICRARHGKFIPKSDHGLLISNTPPLHVNCRSILVPVTEYQELPKEIMPAQWEDPKLLPRQREYDIKVLSNLLSRSTLVRRAFELTVRDIVQTLKQMKIPWKSRYSEEEIGQIMRIIDPDNPRGYDLPILHTEIDYTGMYRYNLDPVTKQVKEEALYLHPRGYTLKTVYHETLHRQYISRYGGVWGETKEMEEGAVDYLATYILSRTHPGKVWTAGCVEPNAKLAVIAMRKSADEVAELLYKARRNNINVWSDERYKFLFEGMRLTESDCEVIANYVKRRKKQFNGVVRKFLRAIGGASQEQKELVKLASQRVFELATNPKELYNAVRAGAPGSWTVCNAVLYMVLHGM